MRITVFGAAGQLGRRIVGEALARGHAVTAATRNPEAARGLPRSVELQRGDASKIEDVAALSRGQNLVIGATRPAPGFEGELVATAESLLRGAALAGTRLLLVGGAGSLLVPGSGGKQAVDDPRYVPQAWQAIARACVAQFEVCKADATADWTYASPPAILLPGDRTGRYKSGADELLVDVNGSSRISMEDFAVAMLDEAEAPKHRRARFTVAACAA